MVALWYRSWTQAFPQLRPQPIEQWRARFQTEYEYQAEIWIATPIGQIVGFMIASGGEIAQIFVDIDVQGTGIGTALVHPAQQLSPGPIRLTTLQQN